MAAVKPSNPNASLRGNVQMKPRKGLEPKEKTADDAVLTEVWHALRPPLAPCIQDVLRNVLFFSHATHIQLVTIPVFIRDGTNVIVEASTGSGKTIAFLVPLFQRLIRRNERMVAATGLPLLTKDIAAVILSPSKTLTRQTYVVAKQMLTSTFNFRLVLFGDTQTNPEQDLKKFTKIPKGGGTIVVSTPSAFLETLSHAKSVGQPLGFLENPLVIMDEADVILDKQGKVMEKVRAHLPSEFNLGLFGATVSSTKAVGTFMGTLGLVETTVPQHLLEGSIVHMDEDEDNEQTTEEEPCFEDHPEEHRGKIYSIFDEESALINLRNCYMSVPAEQAISLLIHLLNKHQKKKHFIFFNDAETLEFVAALLRRVSRERNAVLWALNPYCLHSNIPEMKRSKRFQEFLGDDSGVLLSTDVCAFGIDVREVDYVIHYQPPKDSRVYTHRIGRTGRMGCRGTSVLLLPSELREELAPYLDDLQKTHPIEEMHVPAGVFNAAPLVRALLREPDLSNLALSASAALVKKGYPPAMLAAFTKMLGFEEAIALGILQTVGVAEPAESAPVPPRLTSSSMAKRRGKVGEMKARKEARKDEDQRTGHKEDEEVSKETARPDGERGGAASEKPDDDGATKGAGEKEEGLSNKTEGGMTKKRGAKRGADCENKEGGATKAGTEQGEAGEKKKGGARPVRTATKAEKGGGAVSEKTDGGLDGDTTKAKKGAGEKEEGAEGGATKVGKAKKRGAQ
eukprot:Sspe_Gene.15267::Locus_5305_Transcript_1_1_Confidence_1.000_Length_2269::g.15267::m.15267/K14809/DDX55, SPB4; ATP-dependent RNA helicase DDX55/SPB4